MNIKVLSEINIEFYGKDHNSFTSLCLYLACVGNLTVRALSMQLRRRLNSIKITWRHRQIYFKDDLRNYSSTLNLIK